MEKFYIEYGKFLITFENINFKLCYLIRKICTKDNMFSIEDEQIEILLEGLTAYPILSKFNSLIKTIDINRIKEIESLINIFNTNFKNIIELRNLIIHGKFSAGDPYGNVENFEIRKPKLNKNGFSQNVNIIQISSLKKVNDEILKLETFIDNLNFYLDDKTPLVTKELLFDSMVNSLENINVNLEIITKSLQLRI